MMMRRRPLATAIVLALLSLGLASSAWAANYTVNPNEKASDTNFMTLDELRDSLERDSTYGFSILREDATITINSNDGSLAEVMLIDADKTLTLNGSGILVFSIENTIGALGDATLALNADGASALTITGGANRSGAFVLGSGSITLGASGASAGGEFSIVNYKYAGANSPNSGFETKFMTIQGGSNYFVNNATSNAIIKADESILISGGKNVFLNNTADFGGALKADDSTGITLNAGTNIFVGNVSNGVGGGAISATDDGVTVTIAGGTNIFTGNSATKSDADGRGGAIYSAGKVEITGGLNVFTNNHSGNSGGAIYSVGAMTIKGISGDVLFRGNTDGSDNARSASTGSGSAMYLGAGENRSLYFYDPLLTNAELSINDGDTSEIGRIVFDMSGNEDDQKTVSVVTATKIERGLLSLRDTTLTMGGGFSLNSGTLRAIGEGNVIKSNLTHLITDTLSFDFTGGSTGALLTFDRTANTGSNTFTDQGTTVDIAGFENLAANARVTLATVENANGTFNSARYFTPETTITIRGEDITETRLQDAILETPMIALMSSGGDAKDLTLFANSAITMKHLYYTGSATGDWNATSKTWSTNNIQPNTQKFLHGDSVVFNIPNATTTVNIQDTGVRVADFIRGSDGEQITSGGDSKAGMIIEGGNWNFYGGHIEGRNMGFYSANDTTVTFGGIGSTSASTGGQRTIEQRIIVDGTGTSTIAAAGGTTLLFSNESRDDDIGLMKGGAIYAGNGTTYLKATATGSSILFVGNTNNNASSLGGAIGGDGDVTLDGNISFIGNQAEYGGAISASKVTGSGALSFLGNTASTGMGGAIMADIASLSATTNDIIFRGNNVDGDPNAIYYFSALDLGAASGKSIYLYDPVSGGGSNATFNINADSSQTGRVVFNMIDHGGSTSSFEADTTVNRGTLALLGGTEFGKGYTSGSFTMKNGATLETDSFGNTIAAEEVTLEGGSILAFNLSGATGVADEDDIGNIDSFNLTIKTDEAITIGATSGNEIKIDIARLASEDGYYGLVYDSYGSIFSGMELEDVFKITNTSADGGRYGKLELVSDSDKLYLSVSGADIARDLTWTGGDSNLWVSGVDLNSGANNWKYDEDDPDASPPIVAGAPAPFKNADSVTFDNTVAADKQTVTVDSDGVAVGSMNITGGKYSYVGSGEISGTEDLTIKNNGTTASFANKTSFDGKLVIDGDDIEVAFAEENTRSVFKDGVSIKGDDTVVTFGSGFITEDSSLNITGDGTTVTIKGQGAILAKNPESREDAGIISIGDGSTLELVGTPDPDNPFYIVTSYIEVGGALGVDGGAVIIFTDEEEGGVAFKDGSTLAIGAVTNSTDVATLTVMGYAWAAEGATVNIVLKESLMSLGNEANGQTLFQTVDGDLLAQESFVMESVAPTEGPGNLFSSFGLDYSEANKIKLNAVIRDESEYEDTLVANVVNMTGVSPETARASFYGATNGQFIDMLEDAFKNPGSEPNRIMSAASDWLADNPGDYAGALVAVHDIDGLENVTQTEMMNALYLNKFVNGAATDLYSGDALIGSGVVVQNATNAVLGTARQFGKQILNHGIVLSLESLNNPRSDYVFTYRGLGSLLENPRQNQNRIWASAFGVWEDMGKKNSIPGYSYDAHGLMVGYDRFIGPVLLGGSFGYARGDLDEDQIDGDGKIDSYNFNVYGSYTSCTGFFGILNAGYTHSNNKIDRLAGGFWNRSKYHSNTWNFAGRVGYQARLSDAFTLTPTIGLDYYHVKNNTFTSTGNGIAQRYSGVKAESFALPIDLEASYTAKLDCDASLTVTAKGGYAYDFKNTGVTGTMRYVGGFTPTPIRGVKPGHHSWNVGAGLKYENTRFDVEVNYQYTSRSKLDNHQVSGMVGIKF